MTFNEIARERKAFLWIECLKTISGEQRRFLLLNPKDHVGLQVLNVNKMKIKIANSKVNYT